MLEAAIQVADRGGAEAITMRRVAQELGVEAMSLYHHVPNKDAILDGVVDAVYAAIALPKPNAENWRDAIRAHAEETRNVLARHSWAVGLLDSRPNPGMATLKRNDAVLGVFREAGFSLETAAHAISLLDSYVDGYVMQEAALPMRTNDELEDLAANILEQLPTEELPYLAEMIADHVLQPGYDYAQEFGYGLDLILDGLEARRTSG